MSQRELAALELRRPGQSSGLTEVFRWRFLLQLLIKKEIRVRYRGSVLGMAWSYVKPGVQLLVYWLAMGHFLRMGQSIPNYVVYLFSGIVMTNFFSEVMRNTTRSIIDNAPLVDKIYMPRELFPVSSLWVAFVHLLPQLAVLFVASLITGWRPSWLALGGLLGSVVIVAVFALGAGLAFAAFNVFFRDAENLVELVNMVAIWLTPVFYSWVFVHDALPRWAYLIYQANPLAAGVQLSHAGFWSTTSGGSSVMPADFMLTLGLAALISIVTLWAGQAIFARLEGRFAEEL